MSRPSRIHDRRASSSRRPVDSATAVARPPASAGRLEDDEERLRRAGRGPPAGRAGRRSGPGLSVAARRPPGRSRTSRSTERPASSAPPMARPSSRVSGVMTTSHSSRTPRATASTGSKLRDRSSQATIEPWRLGLGREPQDERRPAARAVAADRDAGRAGQAARPEDRVERREPGVDDPVVGGGRGRAGAARRPGSGPRAVPGPSRARQVPGPPRAPGASAPSSYPIDPRSCRLPSEPGGSPRLHRHVRRRGSPSDGLDLEHLVLRIGQAPNGVDRQRRRRPTRPPVTVTSRERPSLSSPTMLPMPAQPPRRSPSDRSSSSTTTPRSSGSCAPTSSATASRS